MASVIWEVEPLRVELQDAVRDGALEHHDAHERPRALRARVSRRRGRRASSTRGRGHRRGGPAPQETRRVRRGVCGRRAAGLGGVGPSGGTPDLSDLPAWCLPDARRAIRRDSTPARASARSSPRSPPSTPPPTPPNRASRPPVRASRSLSWTPGRSYAASPSARSSDSSRPRPRPRPRPGPRRARDVVPSYYTVAATPDDDLDALTRQREMGFKTNAVHQTESSREPRGDSRGARTPVCSPPR